MVFNNFTEQLFFSTVRIELLENQTMGTGFICEVKAKNGAHYQFLVTNKHVIKSSGDNIKLVFNLMNNENRTINLGQTFITETSKIDEGAYFTHPNDNIDLACINISAVFNQRADIFWAAITIDFIADYKTDGVLAGNNIFFVGYPADRYDTVNNLPILRSGIIASLPQVDFGNESMILIDAQVYPGSSGSPVFSVCNGQHKFVGVICRTMIKNHKIEITDKSFSNFQEVIGIGLVIKSDCVKELLENAVTITDTYLKK